MVMYLTRGRTVPCALPTDLFFCHRRADGMEGTACVFSCTFSRRDGQLYLAHGLSVPYRALPYQRTCGYRRADGQTFADGINVTLFTDGRIDKTFADSIT